MKSKLLFLTVLVNVVSFCKAQDSAAVISASMFENTWKYIFITGLDGWIYREGNDSNWAAKDIDTAGWKKFKPIDLSVKNADKNGKVEGWFRIKIKADSSLRNVPLGISLGGWAKTDIYLDGHYIASSGTTENGKAVEGPRPFIIQSHPIDLKPGVEYVIALHVVDYPSPFRHSLLRTEAEGGSWWLLATIVNTGELNNSFNIVQNYRTYFTLYASICSVLSILFWLLYFQNRSEKNLLLIAIGTATYSIAIFCNDATATDLHPSFISSSIYGYTAGFLYIVTQVITIFILARLLKRKITFFLKLYVLIYAASALINEYFFGGFDVWITLSVLFFGFYLLISSWKNLKGAQWAVAVGLILTFIWSALYGYNLRKNYYSFPFPSAYLYIAGNFLSLPLSLMVYVSIRVKEILKDVQTNAKQVVQLSEEKKEHAVRQQKVLEEEVARQTIELRASFDNLKSTQSQLIQAEKMASLGELTAGIAHEIQNPLNFVNNFSEVNKELIEEVEGERHKMNGGRDEVLEAELLNDIKKNNEKISFHGKRADSIVKNMMQHSRTSTGQKEPTDINALADEYLRLSYHGMRANDKNSNATLQTDFDNTIGKINVIPQDIGRVLLNLFNNAFYATSEKRKAQSSRFEAPEGQYVPTVTIVTKKLNARPDDPVGRGKIEIRVSDNGNGIPASIKDKIFQPFFTTKPTGEGTGLGLSLSYDIIKAHGGEIKVETREAEGSEFIIQLPIV